MSCIICQLLGLWLAVHMFIFYRRAIQRHIRTILEFNQEFKIEHQIQHSQDLTRNCWLLFFLWTFFNVLIQVTVEEYYLSFTIPKSWMDNIITNCNLPKKYDPDHHDDIYHSLRLNEMFFKKIYIETGSISAIVGAYYGIVIDVIFLGGTPQNINLTRSRCKLLARFVLTFIIWLCPLMLTAIISKSIFRSANNYSGEYLVRYAIPYFLCSMLLFSYSKSIMSRLGIVNIQKQDQK